MNTDLIEKVTDYIIDGKSKDWTMDIEHFDWVPGVGLYGIYSAYQKTKRQKYMDFLKGWIQRHLREAYVQKTVNSTAPLLTVLCMYETFEGEELIKVCKDLAEYILSEAPLTMDGGLEHTVTEAVEGFSEQIWADTLFMVCIFLAKLSVVKDEKKYADFAAKQLLIHHRVLSDGSGLYFHGYSGTLKNHMSGVRWGRANGWIVYATAEILKLIPEFEGREEVMRMFERHAAALKQVQDISGGFHTILDDSDSYIEISATAAIAAGIRLGVESGFLPREYMQVSENATEAVINSVAEDGAVMGVSTGTPVMPDADAYKKVVCCPTLYGQGLAAMAF